MEKVDLTAEDVKVEHRRVVHANMHPYAHVVDAGTFGAFPYNIVLRILRHLAASDLLSLRLSCRFFSRVVPWSTPAALFQNAYLCCREATRERINFVLGIAARTLSTPAITDAQSRNAVRTLEGLNESTVHILENARKRHKTTHN